MKPDPKTWDCEQANGHDKDKEPPQETILPKQQKDRGSGQEDQAGQD